MPSHVRWPEMKGEPLQHYHGNRVRRLYARKFCAKQRNALQLSQSFVAYACVPSDGQSLPVLKLHVVPHNCRGQLFLLSSLQVRTIVVQANMYGALKKGHNLNSRAPSFSSCHFEPQVPWYSCSDKTTHLGFRFWTQTVHCDHAHVGSYTYNRSGSTRSKRVISNYISTLHHGS